ncbi:MAG TPA: tryptophan 2,3-dioxygenase [Thermoanaerobaculia bacterium]|jgi:tryptophan 2,3-dioxygenase|nr:tryptophan 2,3-dioxygenase [Thermoanaerobaculia bacterium]
MTDSDPNARLGGALTDFEQRMSYGDYLALDQILEAQHPRSDDPNELLFIIQHQTSELWIKLMLHELEQAIERVRRDELPPAFKCLARVSRIFEQLVQSWSVLATLTPSEYARIRPHLGHSSGFQSWQYRLVEFYLGNKSPVLIGPHAHRPDLIEILNRALAAPSLYDEAIRLLARRGFAIDPSVLDRDFTRAYVAHPSVEAAWLAIYRNSGEHFELYELSEELVDLEDTFLQWRFRHLVTVSRIIGAKPGTGGTEGVPYLRRVLETRLFPELWQARTEL